MDDRRWVVIGAPYLLTANATPIYRTEAFWNAPALECPSGSRISALTGFYSRNKGLASVYSATAWCKPTPELESSTFADLADRFGIVLTDLYNANRLVVKPNFPLSLYNGTSM